MVEYLTPEESERFLSVVQEWPGTDVRHMVLLAYVTGMTHKSASFTKKKYAQFLPHTLTAISNQAADLLMKNGRSK